MQTHTWTRASICAKCIVRNGLAFCRDRLGIVRYDAGATHRRRTLDQSLSYIDAVFDDYLRVSGLDLPGLNGKQVLEIGPGDSYGVAIRFIAAGAARVACVDRFESAVDRQQQTAIYRKIGDRLSGEQRARFDQFVFPDQPEAPSSAVEPVLGQAIEDCSEKWPAGSFDLMVSRAVLQEIADLDSCYLALDRLLAPGGLMVHKIDCRDYGLFSNKGLHPLEMLTVSDGLYSLMSSYEPIPKRRLAGGYADALRTAGYDVHILHAGFVGQPNELEQPIENPDPQSPELRAAIESVNQIRPRLLARFAALPALELASAGFWLIARKPAAD